jgi:hypothetical protein
MDNSKLPSFGKSDKQMADAFGMSVSDFRKVKKQIVSDMTKPKATPKPKVKVKAKTADQARAKATKKTLTPSEKAFIKNQKEKAKATKRTGVYPNTAN